MANCVRLVAPDGCERQMILVRGGTGDNFGNPTACPAQPFKLKDGATAVALSGTANNVVGTFAPEEPLTSFTGNPTGTWHIRICDGTAATTGTLDYVKLNFVTCVGPTATRSVVPACGTNQFFVAVNVTNMGTASSYTITNNIDGSTVNVPGVGVYNAGPFTSGANVTVTLVHSDDVSCNAVLPAISYTCPPANDDCANAILLTPGAVCNPVAGTVLGSTQSAPNSTCDGFGNTADDDVWYRFVATRTEHRIIFNAQFDGVVELRTSPCNGTIIDCEDNNFGAPFIETLTVPGLTIGTTYYIRAFSWSAALPANPNFTICVVAPDCLGAYGGPAIPGAACSDGDPNTLLDAYNSNCVCEGLPCTTDLAIDFTMDASWYMVVTDEQGDGITGGGYVVRRTNGTLLQPYTRVIDNRANYAGVTPSQVSGPPVTANAFNIPLSTDRLIYTSCDKMDWRTTCGGEYVVATDNPAVTAQYGVTNSTSGYEMWWFAPNGGYSFRRTQYHSTTNGLAASATRACHFKPNTWAGSPLQPNTLYNVKVRSIVAGAPGNWGPACRFAINNTLAGCPLTKLMDIPDNQYLSCGQMRLANSTSTYVYARNVRRMTGSCTWQNANRYQFRFRIVGEGINVVKTSATNQIFVNTVGLLCGKTYQVDVRASFNNGANWCVTTPSGINDPAWGDVCT
ncbi:MAG: hypothetical protein IPJ85_03510 [Flavobacteriales bacterium]|nr:hypothetical protein [Flavobacteriales bacterium]